MKNVTKITLVVVLVGVVGWFLWQNYFNKNNSKDIDTHTVSYSSITETVSASGDVTPVEYANLSFVVPALVKKINADVGDSVKKGDVLIVLDRNALLSDIYTTRLEVEKTQAQERLLRRNWDDYKPEKKEQIVKNSEQARSRLASVQAQLINTRITAPFDGIVTQKNVNVGEVAQGIAMRIINDDKMNIEVLMSETDAAKMHKEQKAYATFDAYGDKQFDISMIAIDPEATKIQDVTYYKIKFTLPKDVEEQILSGMSVDVDVVINQKEHVLTVPLRFVRKDDKGEYVYVKDAEDGYQKKYINTGVKGDDGNVEIVNGLEMGMVVYAVRDEDVKK